MAHGLCSKQHIQKMHTVINAYDYTNIVTILYIVQAQTWCDISTSEISPPPPPPHVRVLVCMRARVKPQHFQLAHAKPCTLNKKQPIQNVMYDCNEPCVSLCLLARLRCRFKRHFSSTRECATRKLCQHDEHNSQHSHPKTPVNTTKHKKETACRAACPHWFSII